MKETNEFLNNLLSKNDVVVVATSGGPDSMFLLYALNKLKKKYNLKIICAHVNHGLRKESKKEAEFVKNFCVNNNIIFEYYVIGEYKNNKFSEAEARSKRYKFFNEVVKKYKAKYLFTAHHGDDLIETVLMRIVRGSNLKGYAGISKIQDNGSYKTIRPLLYLTKEEIKNYLDDNNIEYVVDKSNEDEKYTRNRFRKQVLPQLKKEDKLVNKKFLQYSEEIEKANNYINSIVTKKYKKIVNNNTISIDKLLKEDKYIQERIIERVIEDIQKSEIFDTSKKDLNNILNLVNSNNVEINLKDGFIARRSYNNLIIEKKNKSNKYEYILDDDLTILDKYKFSFVNSSSKKDNYILRLYSKDIKLPLVVRCKKDGDRIEVKNLNGSKKIKDIFIDLKMDIKKREEYPVVLDSNDSILWIPGIKKSRFDKEIYEKYDIILKYTEEKNE